jgi:hypothetical protein
MRCTVAASTPIANNSVAQEWRRSCDRITLTLACRQSDSMFAFATTGLANCSRRSCRRIAMSSADSGTDGADDSVFTSRNAESDPTRDKATLISAGTTGLFRDQHLRHRDQDPRNQAVVTDRTSGSIGTNNAAFLRGRLCLRPCTQLFPRKCPAICETLLPAARFVSKHLNSDLAI